MGKYLFVDSSEISMNCTYKKDFKNKTDECRDFLEILFDMYRIPSKYQKIAIELCIHNIFVNADAREAIYDYPFDMTGKPIIEKDNKKFVTGEGLKVVLNGDKLIKINFQTPVELVTKDDVFNFYAEIHKNGYFKDYLRVLVQLFSINVDLDLLFEIYEKEKNRRKVLKLYKKNIESRDKHE